MGVFGVLLIMSWGVYSYFFKKIYQEAAVFATEGAQKIIQMLEILNYRGAELLPFFIIYFTLVSLSLFYVMYQYIYQKQYQYPIKSTVLSVMSIICFIFILSNLMNKFALFLGLLVITSVVIMIAIGLTVNYLYMKSPTYEVGDLIRKAGPFTKLSDAQSFSLREIKKLEKRFLMEGVFLESMIYVEENKGHYVDIFVENKIGESSESNEKNHD